MGTEIIAITGGGGFVGRAILNQLRAQRPEAVFRILARSDYPDLRNLPGVELHRCDLSGPFEPISQAFSGVKSVFHVAAKAGVWGPEESFFRANVTASRNVVLAARETGVAHIVYTSTPSVVFNGCPFNGEDEQLPYGRNWLCAYAETKAQAEREMLGAHGDSMRICALRPHLVYGPGDPHILPKIVDRVRRGRLRAIGDRRNRVDISFIDNVAHAHLLALSALERGDAGGEAFFVSDGAPVNLWDWIETVVGAIGLSLPSKPIPLAVAYGGGALCEALWTALRRTEDPPMTRFVAVELAKSHYFSTAKAERLLGYKPIVNSTEAMEKTIDWLRSISS